MLLMLMPLLLTGSGANSKAVAADADFLDVAGAFAFIEDAELASVAVLISLLWMPLMLEAAALLSGE